MKRTPAKPCLGLAGFLATAVVASAQVPASISTCDAAGRRQHVFGEGEPVYLAVGPAADARLGSPGLPDGVYAFQVTDFDRTQLLSTDPVTSRLVVVLDGAIRGVPCGGHAAVAGPDGSLLVRLDPALARPSGDSGGTPMLAWLTPASRYEPGQGTFGFQAGSSVLQVFQGSSGNGPNVSIHLIEGTVYYDYNKNGMQDMGDPLEVPLPRWRIRLYANGVSHLAIADANGRFQFLIDPAATNVLRSIAPPPGFIPLSGGRWLATTPRVQVVPMQTSESFEGNFGNLFFVSNPGSARSVTYWHEAGRDVLEDCDPVWRNALDALCLRTNLTSPPYEVEDTLLEIPLMDSFDQAFLVLARYLTSPSNKVLAHRLSVQFAAANLNIACGPLMGLPTYVDRLGDGVLVSLDFMVRQTTALLCMPCAANTGPGGDEDCRELILGCLMEWDELNSSGTRTYSRSNGPPPVVY